MKRKICRDHGQPCFRNGSARGQRGDHTVAQPARFIRFVVGTGEDLLIEKTLPRQRAAEVHGLRVGECRVHRRPIFGCGRDREQRRPNGGQQPLEFDVRDGGRLHEAPQQAVA